MKSALATSIVTAYEDNGLGVTQICEAMPGLEELVVKSVLLQYSTKYREITKAAESEEEQLVSKEEIKEFITAYKSIARYAEDDYVKERALKNLINMGLKVNEGLGEKDHRKLLKELGGTGNILNLNLILQQARAAKARVLNPAELAEEPEGQTLQLEEKTA